MFKLSNFLSLTLCVLILHSMALQAQDNYRSIINFDSNWHFLKDDAKGAEVSAFDDSKWRKLDVPHDWSIEGTYNETNPTGRGGGYLPAGIGWYRKTFTLNENDAKRKISVEFDGVMANSDVWINGFHLGKRPNGYISFSYELTGHLKFGKGEKNVLAVRADNSLQPASRYYTGAGIYRHVRLVITNPIHIAPRGIYVRSTQVNDKKANLNLQIQVTNESSAIAVVSVSTTITDPSGKIVKTVESNIGTAAVSTTLTDPSGKIVKTVEANQLIQAGRTGTVNLSFEVLSPQLWDTNNPNLYHAMTQIKSGKVIIDEHTTSFGIRDSKFEATTGYWLNGKNIKIKGVCLHHDGGALGSAVPLGVWEHRFKLLKEVGVNAIRTAHNPVAPEFLDLCDRMGFLVMDESFDTWTVAKPGGEKGYNLYFNDWWKQDTRDLVVRDRNHPSIILYSVGNEIRDNLNDSSGFKRYKDQQDLVHQFDSDRPVTMALFRPGSSKVYTNGFAETMDIVGQNYREKELVELHQAKPQLKVIGTENGQELSEWLILRDNPYMAGQFLWTGFDYLGEAKWPEISNKQGLFDRVGNWKQLSYQRQSWWSDKPVVHIMRKDDNAGVGNWVANWTPLDFGTYDAASIQVYSNCDEVELFLNGKSLGVQQKSTRDAPRSWDITFEKGSLKAVAKNKGQIVATDEQITAGDPEKIVLTVDRSCLSKNPDEVSFVTAQVVDANGIVCPNVEKLIKFSITNTGEIIALDNGNIISHENYQGSERQAYNGRCLAVVRALATKGQFTVTASSADLKSGSITIEIK